MKVTETEHYVQFKSRDMYGKFTIEFQKDGSQIRMNTTNGDSYVDISPEELEVIRDCINLVLEPKKISNLIY